MAESTRRRDRDIFLAEYQGTTITIPLSLGANEVQRLFRRHYDGISRSVFLIRLYGQRLGDAAYVQSIQHLQGLMDKQQKLLDSQQAVIEAHLSGQSIQVNPAVAVTVEAKILHPLIKRYALMLQQADGLIRDLYVLWLDNQFSDDQLRQAIARVIAVPRTLHADALNLSRGLRSRIYPRQNADGSQPDGETDDGGAATPTSDAVSSIEPNEEQVVATET